MNVFPTFDNNNILIYNIYNKYDIYCIKFKILHY